MDTQKAIERIEKSEQVGIILGRQPTLDTLAAAEVLSRFLVGLGKTVGPIASSPPPSIPHPELFKTLASARPLPKEFLILVDTAEAPIAQLRYEKHETSLEIVLSPKSISLREDLVSFKEGRVQCDCAIAIAVPDVEDAAEGLAVEPEFFTETPLINFDTAADNKQYGEVNLVDPSLSSIAEIVYRFITLWPQHVMEQETATLLLAGILDRTDGLRGNPGPDTLLAASELVRRGGLWQNALALTRQEASLDLLQLFGRATVRSKLAAEEGVLWSFLTAEDFGKTKRSPEDVKAALQYLDQSFPPSRVVALLWQDPIEKNVRAILSSKRAFLETIRGSAPAEFRSPYLEITSSFGSFQEAEEYLAPLLQEVP